MQTARTLLISTLAITCCGWLVGCGDEEPVLLEEVAPGCNPFGTSAWPKGEAPSESAACLLPFPSAFATRADPASPTGVRVDLRAESLPLRDGKTALDVRPYDAADGFSPIGPILLHFGADVDLELEGKGLSSATHRDLAASIADGASIAILDLQTGKRVAYFVEMDEHDKPGYEAHRAFIIRPMEPMEMGHRHVVAIRQGLRGADGEPFASPPAFAALRDKRPTTSAVVEAAREPMSEVFDFLAQHGYPRGELLLAWDFPVASEEWILGPLLSMRREALEIAGESGLGYTITAVRASPGPDTARIVEGTFDVPCYLRDDDTLALDDAHRPLRQARGRAYPFTMVIPKKAEVSTDPLPLAIVGHGIFDDGRTFVETGEGALAIQAFANGYGVVVIASDWTGLTAADRPRIQSEIGGDLDRLGIVTGKLQQSLVNHLVLTRLARGALADDPAAQVGKGPLVDRSRTFYWGASLGGIQGASLAAISPDIARAALGVPGGAWSTMLTRSVVLSAIRDEIDAHYPDPIDVQILAALMQSRFDPVDPVNVGKLLFARPLPDAPSNRLAVLQEAIGDAQVPNVATEILARALGVAQIEPANEAVWGLESVSSPTLRSALSQYKMAGWDQPLPPVTNRPAETDNGVHAGVSLLPNLHLQIAKLWLDGAVEQFCAGPCNPD